MRVDKEIDSDELSNVMIVHEDEWDNMSESGRTALLEYAIQKQCFVYMEQELEDFYIVLYNPYEENVLYSTEYEPSEILQGKKPW